MSVMFVARPIFSGGTGRSGTTILAKLLRCHPEVRASKPLEIRCVTDSAGLLDVCLGPTDDAPLTVKLLSMVPGGVARQFNSRMRKQWWDRANRLGKSSGLHRGMSAQQREGMIRKLHSSVKADPARAGREFMDDLMKAQGVTSERFWVDTSPPNAVCADRIFQVATDALFVHMVRDGRDTAASVMAEPWGPSTPQAAIAWWEGRMRRAHHSLGKVPGQQVLTVSLEDLVVREREATYRELLDFLGLSDRPRMRRYFSEEMPADRVNVGAWASRVADPEMLEALYVQARDRLLQEGIQVHERI